MSFQHVVLAKQFEKMVKNDPNFVVTHKVTLGLVCFRLKVTLERLSAVVRDACVCVCACVCVGVRMFVGV